MDWPESTEPLLVAFPAGRKRDGGLLAGTQANIPVAQPKSFWANFALVAFFNSFAASSCCPYWPASGCEHGPAEPG